MRATSLLIVTCAALLVGCQSTPRPAAGLCGLRLQVIAEPKSGAISNRVSVFDQPGGTNSGEFEKVDYSDLHDVVVWIEPVDVAKIPAVTTPAIIDIRARETSDGVTHVACVHQKIVFHNVGASALSPFCVSDGNEFNLGTISPGGKAEVVVKSPGLIEILGDSLRDPIARLYIAPSPWVTLTHSGATVTFNDVPPGSYRIVSWHPRLPGSITDVRLLPDQVATQTIRVGVNSLPKITAK